MVVPWYMVLTTSVGSAVDCHRSSCRLTHNEQLLSGREISPTASFVKGMRRKGQLAGKGSHLIWWRTQTSVALVVALSRLTLIVYVLGDAGDAVVSGSGGHQGGAQPAMETSTPLQLSSVSANTGVERRSLQERLSRVPAVPTSPTTIPHVIHQVRALSSSAYSQPEVMLQ